MQRRQSQRPLRGAGAGRSLQRWQARICRQGGAAPRAVHGRVTVTVTRHNSGAGAERPPARRRACAASHGDMLATSWHVGEPRETSRILGTGDAPKSLAWINSASWRYAAWKSAWLGSGLGFGLAPSPGGGSSGQVAGVGAGPRAPRHALKSQGPPPESRDPPGTPRVGPRERPGCAGRWHSE